MTDGQGLDGVREAAAWMRRQRVVKRGDVTSVQVPSCLVRSRGEGHQPRLIALLRSRDELRSYLVLSMLTKGRDDRGARTVTLQSHTLARAIGLPDPTSRGSVQQMGAVLRGLQKAGLIEVTGGRADRTVRMLDPGSDSLQDPPEFGAKYPYISLPKPFFTNGWHARLSTVALGGLLIHTDWASRPQSRGSYKSTSIAPTRLDDEYGLSRSSLTAANKELVSYGLLLVERKIRGEVTDDDAIATRNAYQLQRAGFEREAWHPTQP